MVPPALIKGWSPVMSTSSSDLWIETDHNGVIVGWAADIVRLTGYSARSMFGLLLKIMFSADGPVSGQPGLGMMDQPAQREGALRSRDAQTIRVRYRSEPAPHSSDTSRTIMRWTFERI